MQSLESRVGKVHVSEVFEGSGSLKEILDDLFEGEDFLYRDIDKGKFLINKYRAVYNRNLQTSLVRECFKGKTVYAPENFLVLLKKLTEKKKLGWTLKIKPELLPDKVNVKYVTALINDIENIIEKKYKMRYRLVKYFDIFLAGEASTEEIEIKEGQIRLYRLADSIEETKTAKTSAYLQLKEFKSVLKKGEVELPEEYFYSPDEEESVVDIVEKETPRTRELKKPAKTGAMLYDENGLYDRRDRINHPAFGTVTVKEIKYNEGGQWRMTVKPKKGEDVVLTCGGPKGKPV